MHVLTVGGAGYIGSVLSAHLLVAGHQVTVLDDLSTGHRQAVPAGAGWVEGDLRGAALDDALTREPVDLVIHLAARSLVPESMRDPGLYFGVNVGGIVDLLEGMRRHGPMRILFSSSAAVYGHPATVPIGEDAPCAPVSPYGESKWMVERILDWYGRVHGLCWTALRYFNAAGAAYDRGEDHEPETHLIPLAIEVARGRRGELAIFGADYPTVDGTCVRDYIHVLDLAEAHRLAAEQLMTGKGRIYNLGTGRGDSVQQVVESARRVTGNPLATRVAPRREGDPAVLVAAADRAGAVLGWQPTASSLDTIISTAWEWHRAHPEGYAS